MRISDWSSDVCSSDLSKDTLDRDRTGGIPANREKSEPFVRDDEQEPAEERADLEELQTGQTGDLGEQDNANDTNRQDTTHANGRATRRERVCTYVQIPVVAVPLNTIYNTHNTNT